MVLGAFSRYLSFKMYRPDLTTKFDFAAIKDFKKDPIINYRSETNGEDFEIFKRKNILSNRDASHG